MHARKKAKWLCATAVMSALLAILAPMSIPTGSIPLSLGVFAVYLAAALLPPSAAMASLCIYLALGGMGLPVFSAYRGGPQMLVGPTGGFLLGYLIIGLVVSHSTRRTNRLFWHVIFAIFSLILFYLLGTFWYMHVMSVGFLAAISLCVFPFVIFDLIKILAALLLAKRIRLISQIE